MDSDSDGILGVSLGVRVVLWGLSAGLCGVELSAVLRYGSVGQTEARGLQQGASQPCKKLNVSIAAPGVHARHSTAKRDLDRDTEQRRVKSNVVSGINSTVFVI